MSVHSCNILKLQNAGSLKVFKCCNVATQAADKMQIDCKTKLIHRACTPS